MDDEHQACVFISCDGEESQIRVLVQEAMAEKFSDRRIVIAKTPRSCSGITQASDISEGFKEEHLVLKKSTEQDRLDPLLEQALVRAFETYQTENPSSDIKAAKRTTYIQGLLAMTYVTQNVQTRTTVQHGYSQWGQKGGALDFFKIMEAPRAEIPTSQLEIMHQNLPTAINFIREDGRIPEAWYDGIGVARIDDGDSAEKEEGKYSLNYFS